MRLTPATIEGMWLIDMEPHRDERGFFSRTFCADTLERHGLDASFVQHSMSHSHTRGTIRGLHFQHTPHEETKLVRCLAGAVFDVILDLRPWSRTFLRWEAVELSRENRRQVYVPKGCAHGFQALTDDVEVSYMISARYAPAAADGYRYNDPAFGIDWPLPATVLSERDRSWGDFALRPITSRQDQPVRATEPA